MAGAVAQPGHFYSVLQRASNLVDQPVLGFIDSTEQRACKPDGLML